MAVSLTSLFRLLLVVGLLQDDHHSSFVGQQDDYLLVPFQIVQCFVFNIRESFAWS